MVEIVLVLNPCWDVETAPIGLGYLAEYVRSHGFACRILDLNLAAYLECGCQDFWRPQLHKHWMDRALFKEVLAALDAFLEHWARKLAEEEAGLIGFSVNAASRYFTVEMARRIRALAPDKVLVWGGPGVFNAEELVSIPSHLADCVVIGEGEQTLLEIAQCLNTSRTLPEGIPGTAMPHGDTFRFNPRRQEIPDLDSLPFPTYEGFPLDYYTGTNVMPVLMSRGCPMRCAFCDTTLRFSRFRYRSAQNIMDEISFHASRRVVGTVVFHDALLNGSVKMLGELVELIIASPHSFQWVGNFVVSKRCTPQLYRAMKRSGCATLMYGIESGSDRVLRLMQKHYTAEQASSALRWGHEAGIKSYANFICGFPGETEQDFEQTFRFAEQNLPYIDTVTAVTMMFFVPDSPLYARRAELGVTLDPHSHFHWHDEQGNTPQVRIARVQRLLELFAKNDIPVLTSSLNEVGIDCAPGTRPQGRQR